MTAPLLRSGWTLQANPSLHGLNTLAVHATAPWLVDVTEASALTEVVAYPPLQNHRYLPLGQGSNVLFVDSPSSCIIRLLNQQIQIREHRADYAIIRADAGVAWHHFVMWSLEQGFSGLENLAGIPGNVGASPIQNIGAYGVEVKEFIHVVEAMDLANQTWIQFPADQCAFTYRDSRFKAEPDRYLVTAVEFRLPHLHQLTLTYPGIEDELIALRVASPSAIDVAKAIINLRQEKLPDPKQIANVGSFFKNPIVSRQHAEQLQLQFPKLPLYPHGSGQQCKLPAAWLIEHCGWKGKRIGDAGVSDQHAQVLVNHGQASGADLLALAEQIADSVHQCFGISLVPEVRLIGASWAQR